MDSVVAKMLSISKITSFTAPESACDVLVTILTSLCSPNIPLDTVPHASLPGSPGNGEASWVAMDGTGAPQPQWVLPTESDHAAARRISMMLLNEAKSEVQDMVNQKLLWRQGPKERWRLSRCVHSVLAWMAQGAAP